MKRETIIKYKAQHGRMTAYVQGERQVIWGEITDVNGRVTLKVHSDEELLLKFDFKNIRGFRVEPIAAKKKYPKLQCDCGCKADERYICENCGATFCGTKHGIQDRDERGKAWDLCDKCVPIILGIEKQ